MIKTESCERPPTSTSHDEGSDTDLTMHNRQYASPAQDKLKAKIRLAEKRLVLAVEERDSGIAAQDIQKEINKLRKEIQSDKKELNCKVNKAKRQKRYRDDRQKVLKRMKLEQPNLKVR